MVVAVAEILPWRVKGSANGLFIETVFFALFCLILEIRQIPKYTYLAAFTLVCSYVVTT